MSPFETTTVVVLMLLSAWLLTLLVYMITSPAATTARISAITMLRTLYDMRLPLVEDFGT